MNDVSPENSPTLAAHAEAAKFDINLSSTEAAYIAEAVLAASDLREAVELLANVVSQANVNPVIHTDGSGQYIGRYDMPVGSIHKAIPYLARHGIVVDQYGAIHRAYRPDPETSPQPTSLQEES